MASAISYPALSTTSERIDDILLRICERLQLSATQYQQAEQSYTAICNWLDGESSKLRQYIPQLYPQGSVALGTTVKPLGHEEYDVDLVCELAIDEEASRNPIFLLDLIEERLKENSVYRPLVERKNRCIRVNYERQFHLDILPARLDPQAGGTCLLIPDVALQAFTKTNPKGFGDWFKLQTLKTRHVAFDEARKMATDAAAPLPQPQTVLQKRILQLAVQLFKRWRDIQYAENLDLAPVSIVLTTISGKHYAGEQSIVEALENIVDGVIASLPAYGRLKVCNPANLEEDLSDRWSDAVKYHAFVSGINALASSLRALRAARTIEEGTAIVKKLFGDEITKTTFSEQLKELNSPRDSEKLGVGYSGMLASLSAAAPLPVKRNTFFAE